MHQHRARAACSHRATTTTTAAQSTNPHFFSARTFVFPFFLSFSRPRETELGRESVRERGREGGEAKTEREREGTSRRIAYIRGSLRRRISRAAHARTRMYKVYPGGRFTHQEQSRCSPGVTGFFFFFSSFFLHLPLLLFLQLLLHLSLFLRFLSSLSRARVSAHTRAPARLYMRASAHMRRPATCVCARYTYVSVLCVCVY